MTTSTTDFDVIIVGGGPAGLCAAMYAGRGMLRSVLLERGLTGGELLNTEKIEDYPGFISVLGPDLAEKMTEHAVHFGADIRMDEVSSIKRREDGIFDVETAGGPVYHAPAVIITAGGTPYKLGIPGEAEYAGKGVSYCAVCDGAFFKGETIAVIGGGDAAVEEADYLTRYAAKVYLIHRRGEFRASRVVQERAFKNPKIEIIWNTQVASMEGTGTGMTHLELVATVDGAASKLPVTGAFIFIGFSPNSGIIKQHFDHDASGYIITNDRMETSIPGLFAAGDLRVQLTRQVTTAVGDATTAAIAVEKFLTARKEKEHPTSLERLMIPSGRFVENTWLLWDSDMLDAVVVDPGEDADRILAAIRHRKLSVSAIWLTHAHVDHIWSVTPVREATGAPVLLHAADRRWYDSFAKHAATFGAPGLDSLAAPDGELIHGQHLDVGAHHFEVRHIPGHSQGHVAFIGEGVSVSGDVIFLDSIGRTDLAGADSEQMMASIQSELLVLPDNTHVLPGHGPETTIGRERRENPWLRDLSS